MVRVAMFDTAGQVCIPLVETALRDGCEVAMITYC